MNVTPRFNTFFSRPSRMVCRALTLALLAGLALTATTPALITTSSLDTFATSNEGWQIGSAGVQPARVASAGPDSQIGYLSHFSDGGGSQGKWLM
jgi:hypothetical protein